MTSRPLTAALCAVLALLLAGCSPESTATDSGAQNGSQAVTAAETPIIYDEPASEPPYYYQASEEWGGLPYATADSNIAESGCGLCCAAMAAAYLTGDDYITPVYLLNQVGNRCIDGGMNHMGMFCDELEAIWGFEHTDAMWMLDDAESYLRGGWCLFGGMSGSVVEGHRSYGAHVLFVWKCDESGVYIRDPADPTLTGPISWDEFRAIDWGSFYAIRSDSV